MLSASFRRRGRALAQGQRSELRIFDIETFRHELVFTADEVIEAPNWTPDGTQLIFNAGGQLFRIALQQSRVPELIDTGFLEDLNNDHVLSPDGTTIYVSSDDGHLYAVALSGGTPRRISNVHETPFHYYLHGISPDGEELSYVAVEGAGSTARTNIFSIPSRGGPDLRLSDIDKPNDGPEYSPDGEWIYFNSERASTRPGHSQIFRMRRDGTGIEQLTFDAQVNWFPHLSPDGKHCLYLSYPEETTGHPPDRAVVLKMMAPEGGQAVDLAAFNGGQGTINVNSWAPDSRRFAFVAYPAA